MLFAHGFGCDQNMWRHVVPHFDDRFRVVRFDHIGSGGSVQSEVVVFQSGSPATTLPS
ncbi:MAG: hypothetical protein JJE52_05140 [Acidimicrobiia bacterium]|nr:hypothetical protein [Acidimicrobiia bacterium]